MLRQRVIFEGHVQGVGFRFNTHTVAQSFDVTGYVRNLPSGQVELVVEGDEQELGRFVQAIRDRMGEFIHRVTIDSTDPIGQFDAFEIRY